MFEKSQRVGNWGVGSKGRAVWMEHWVLRGAVTLGSAAVNL